MSEDMNVDGNMFAPGGPMEFGEETETPPLPPLAPDMRKWVQQFRDLRDMLERYDEKIAKERLEISNLQQCVLAKIAAFMRAHNLENLRTEAGTVSRKTKYTATVADAELFMNLVKAGNWDLIERRANSTAVKAWVEEHKELPAGVNLNAVESVGVQRPTKKKSNPISAAKTPTSLAE